MGRRGNRAGAGGEQVARVREILEQQRLDAALVLDLLNVRHLCGFTGSNGLLLISREEAVLYTDSRYTLQAREEAAQVAVAEVRDLESAAASRLEAVGAAYVGLQHKSLTASRLGRLVKLARETDLVDLGTELDALREVKSARELEQLREAARLAEEALYAVLPLVREGISEWEVAREFHLETLRRGAEGLSFDTIVAGAERGALPHAKPGARRFRAGDLVVFDFGVRLQGYCSDETVTVPVGRVDPGAREVYEVVRKAQGAGLAAVRAGVPLVEVDRAARGVIAEAGYGDAFGHGTGHGVGLAVHEMPTVGPRSKGTARRGAVFTVEPGIYLPGRYGVRLEDTVVVTETGWEPITKVSKEFSAALDQAG